jgi:hypothetical protein
MGLKQHQLRLNRVAANYSDTGTAPIFSVQISVYQLSPHKREWSEALYF